MKNESFTDKLVVNISQYKAVNVLSVSTLGVIVGSIPTVYFLAYLFGAKYTFFIFFISAVLPILLTPLTVYIILSFSKHLKHYKEHLREEIEENRKKDFMLFEQARFVLMGEMMANISHQWKQPLNTLGLAIVSTRLSSSSPEALEKNFDIMEDNISYLSNTIDDFMSFFDKKTPEEVRSIKNIIDEIQSIMKAQIESRGIKLTINMNEKLKTVEMTSVISQVLLNLLNNAKDAMEDEIDNKEIILHLKATQTDFIISCCDNGIGVKKELADKLFDPYFTTKEKKQGTGIGLYMSKQIITKIFDGTIELDKDSKNTCFRITIPCSKNCNLESLL